MPLKNAKKKCIRSLNEFKYLIIFSRLCATWFEEACKGNASAVFFSDADKSLQYVKRRIRKGSAVTHEHDPLLIHLFHLHYFVCIATGRVSFIKEIVSGIENLKSSRVWLLRMMDEDEEVAKRIISKQDDCLWHSWNRAKTMTLRVMSEFSDADFIFRRSLVVYCSKVLCHGHDRPPSCRSVFSSIFRREITGSKIPQKQRLSPTQLVRWQGGARIAHKQQVCRLFSAD